MSKHAAASRGRRLGGADAFGWGALTLAGAIGAIRSGFSGAAMMLGFFGLVVAVIAMARGRVGWARLRSRASGGALLGASMMIMTVGALAPPPTTPASATAVTPASATAVTPALSTAVTPALSTTSTAGPVATATPTLDPVASATAHRPTPAPTVAAPPVAQPAPAPATVAPSNGATALCNDGTLYFKAHHQGACASHGGVKVFYK